MPNVKQCKSCDTILKVYGYLGYYYEEDDLKYIKISNFRKGHIPEDGIDDTQKSDFNNNICPFCKRQLIDTYMDSDEINIIAVVSDYNRQLLDIMIELKQKDIIEYELKMSQFRTQYEQMQALKKQQQMQEREQRDSTKPKCPTCNSTNIEKISLGKKAVGGAMFGIFSSNVRKTMHCKNCGYKW